MNGDARIVQWAELDGLAKIDVVVLDATDLGARSDVADAFASTIQSMIVHVYSVGVHTRWVHQKIRYGTVPIAIEFDVET